MNRGSISTCSPKSVLTKGAKAHQGKVGSARLIVYTAHLIRAGLDFQDRVPVLSVLGLPLDMVRARVKFWSGTDGAKLFTRLNLSMPNQFFWYAYFFHPAVPKIFGRVNGANGTGCSSVHGAKVKSFTQFTLFLVQQIQFCLNKFNLDLLSHCWWIALSFRDFFGTFLFLATHFSG